MIQKYLLPEIVRPDLEKRMLEGSLQNEYDKVVQLQQIYEKPVE
jgi:penicillin-binding protein 2